ncbi:MAG TPA: uroporphyrinogen-III synthase [Burkholderiales bacterium]|nr:uroporphyrinogen-III synthase [Burkholderiales bacterium]
MSGGPLAGRRILVTRPSGQGEGLSVLIRNAGGEALAAPAIEIRPLEDLAPFHAVADRLDAFDIAVFVSRNAVRYALSLLRARRGAKPWPARLRLATVGRGSRDELEGQGFSGVIAPSSQADSEALLALPEMADVAGKQVVIFRGEGGRALLGETLRARGARVEHAACYRRVLPEGGGAALASAWAGGAIDAVTVSSSEGLANLLEMLGAEGARRLAQAAFFVPHPRVAEEAARRGLGRVIVAGPGDAEMAATLVAYFGGAR